MTTIQPVPTAKPFKLTLDDVLDATDEQLAQYRTQIEAELLTGVEWPRSGDLAYYRGMVSEEENFRSVGPDEYSRTAEED